MQGVNVLVLVGMLAEKTPGSIEGGSNFLRWKLLIEEPAKGGTFKEKKYDCVAWGKRADEYARTLLDGACVAVTGRLSVQNYKKRDGSWATDVSCQVNEARVLGESNYSAPEPQAEVGGDPAPEM